MTKKTITDFETVEVSKTITICNHCGSEHEDRIMPVAVNPMINSGNTPLRPTNIKASARGDLCYKCAVEFFGFDIPANVSEADIDVIPGEIQITVIRNSLMSRFADWLIAKIKEKGLAVFYFGIIFVLGIIFIYISL